MGMRMHHLGIWCHQEVFFDLFIAVHLMLVPVTSIKNDPYGELMDPLNSRTLVTYLPKNTSFPQVSAISPSSSWVPATSYPSTWSCCWPFWWNLLAALSSWLSSSSGQAHVVQCHSYMTKNAGWDYNNDKDVYRLSVVTWTYIMKILYCYLSNWALWIN